MAFELDFERPLAEIEKRIQNLQRRGDRLRPEERGQIAALEDELNRRTRDLYANLTPWQRVQVARHKQRPYTGDYIKLICDDFFELRGDRRYDDDRALVGGLASIDGHTLMLLGQQKGRDTRSGRRTARHLAGDRRESAGDGAAAHDDSGHRHRRGG